LLSFKNSILLRFNFLSSLFFDRREFTTSQTNNLKCICNCKKITVNFGSIKFTLFSLSYCFRIWVLLIRIIFSKYCNKLIKSHNYLKPVHSLFMASNLCIKELFLEFIKSWFSFLGKFYFGQTGANFRVNFSTKITTTIQSCNLKLYKCCLFKNGISFNAKITSKLPKW